MGVRKDTVDSMASAVLEVDGEVVVEEEKEEDNALGVKTVSECSTCGVWETVVLEELSSRVVFEFGGAACEGVGAMVSCCWS